VGWRELLTMGHVLADTVIEHHRRRLKGRARRITLDLDPTDDPTHGQQEFTFFNGHYDTWCYLPVVATVTFDAEADQYAVAAVLRPGNAPASLGARGLLRRLIRQLRAAFRAPTIRVRLDGGFATPTMFAFLETQAVEYVVAMASNARLEERAQRLMGKARMRSKATGQTAHLYGETRYAAKTWKRRRRVIIKAEVVRHPGRDPKNNPRFVVTNLPGAPKTIYEAVYCQRGDVENRLKELHHGLEMDRTSCVRFQANQFRVLLTLGVHPVPGAPAPGAGHRLRRRAGHHAAGAAAQARGVGRALGASHRAAPAGDLPLALDVAAPRPRSRRDHLRRAANSACRWPAGRGVGAAGLSEWPFAPRRAHPAPSLGVTRRNRLVGPRQRRYNPLRARRDPGRARS